MLELPQCYLCGENPSRLRKFLKLRIKLGEKAADSPAGYDEVQKRIFQLFPTQLTAHLLADFQGKAQEIGRSFVIPLGVLIKAGQPFVD
jgi:hypothetical protein